MMECFETNLQPEQLIARLEVVGRHSCPALYNALEYRRIPMRFLWMPLVYLQEGLGGKAKAITAGVLTGLTVLILAMIFVPFPLRIEAKGESLPIDRVNLYAPWQGRVEEIKAGLVSGTPVSKGEWLIKMFDFELARQISEIQTDIANNKRIIEAQNAKTAEQGDAGGSDPAVVQEAMAALPQKIEMLNNWRARTNADPNRPGHFTIPAARAGIILSADFRENLLGKNVKPDTPLLRIGYTDPKNPKLSEWELQLKIPQKYFGKVWQAFKQLPPGGELDVDVLFQTEPTASYRAKLRKLDIAKAANAENKNEKNEPDPAVLAWARVEARYHLSDKVLNSLRRSGVPQTTLTKLDPLKGLKKDSREAFLKSVGRSLKQEELKECQHRLLESACADDIPLDRQIPTSLLLSNTEVNTRIRCGNHAMGYSLFFGVYEWVYENVIFPYWP
jgi:hypothetical protein